LRSIPAPARVDIIHAGSWQGFAFRRNGIPLVVTEHQYIRHPQFLPQRGKLQTLYHDFFVQQCVARSYSAADAIVTVSEHAARAMRADLTQPVRMIHNWVDTERFIPRAGRARGDGQPFRLLFVGNPSRWKGADVLVPLAQKLGSGFEIVALGGLRRSFEGDALPSNMRLLAPVQARDMPAVYQSADAVLVPTRYEAFGYVAVEAMACGLPVLGFDSTGTAEVCVHDETALLAPVDDVERLAGYAHQLAGDAALRHRLGEAGRKRAVALFSERKAIAAYLALYDELIERRGRRD
jgi:glycosyltransferase involved in cell wall biosynthesis